MMAELSMLDAPLPLTSHSRQSSEFGAWDLAVRGPHPVLAGAVRAYSGLRGELRLARELHPPTGEPAIVINFGAPFRACDPHNPARWSWQADVSVMGPHARPILAETPAAREIMVATLTPAAAHRVLGVPMVELVDRRLPLEALLGSAAKRLFERVHEAASWEARFAALDGFFAERLLHARQPARDVQRLWLAARRAAGPGAIGALAAEAGVSHKHLIGLFREQIGLAPRLVSRLARFNRALRRLNRVGGAGWATAAQDCGYFDQAHLIRDFHDFAGATPRRMQAMRAAFSFRAG